MNLSASRALIRDIPHERAPSPLERIERQMDLDRWRQNVRRSACQEFLGQHDGAPDPAMRIGPWFSAEADRRHNRPATGPATRDDNRWEAMVVAEMLTEILNADAPLDVVVAIAEGW